MQHARIQRHHLARDTHVRIRTGPQQHLDHRDLNTMRPHAHALQRRQRSPPHRHRHVRRVDGHAEVQQPLHHRQHPADGRAREHVRREVGAAADQYVRYRGAVDRARERQRRESRHDRGAVDVGPCVEDDRDGGVVAAEHGVLQRRGERRCRGSVVDWDPESDDRRDEGRGAVLRGVVQRLRRRVADLVLDVEARVRRAEEGEQTGEAVLDDASCEVALPGAAEERWREQVAEGRVCAREEAELARREEVGDREDQFVGNGGERHRVAGGWLAGGGGGGRGGRTGGYVAEAKP